MKSEKIMFTVTMFMMLSFFFLHPVSAQEIGGASVNANIKFFLYDQTDGDSKYFLRDANTGVTTRESQTETTQGSMGVNRSVIYINKQLSDKLSANLDTELIASASATPKIGDPIERATSGSVDVDYFQASFTYKLPNDYEVVAGQVVPPFTWDYGHKYFWHENYHAWYATSTAMTAAWRDTGMELHKDYGTDMFALPFMVGLYNGTSQAATDNNDNKTVLVNLQPDFFQGRLKFNTSYAFGKWDNNDEENFNKYVVGIDIDLEKLRFRSEYIVSQFDNKYLSQDRITRDIENDAWYAKIFWRFYPGWHVMFGYDILDKDYSGYFSPTYSASEKYKTSHISFKYSLSETTSILFDNDWTDGERDDNWSELDIHRMTLGVVITL